jgi:hypothetical protein
MQNLDQIPLRHGFTYLSSETTTLCTLADTFYKIGGTWASGSHTYFEYSGNGKTTYKDGTGIHFLLNGVSDVSSDKNCTICYALYKNGELVEDAQTPHTFEHAHQITNISITSALETLNYDDYLEVYCKSNVAATTLTHKTLQLTFWGDR